MILSRIEDIDARNLSDSYKTVHGIGLCYFDPKDEVLKEFNPTAAIPIYPSEVSKRQFYIVIDNTSLLLSTITLTASITDAAYTVKTSLNYEEDFDTVTANNSIVAFYSQYPSGIIPVTVYIQNNKDTLENVELELDLETF